MAARRSRRCNGEAPASCDEPSNLSTLPHKRPDPSKLLPSLGDANRRKVGQIPGANEQAALTRVHGSTISIRSVRGKRGPAWPRPSPLTHYYSLSARADAVAAVTQWFPWWTGYGGLPVRVARLGGAEVRQTGSGRASSAVKPDPRADLEDDRERNAVLGGPRLLTANVQRGISRADRRDAHARLRRDSTAYDKTVHFG